MCWHACVAQSVGDGTLDFKWGPDVRVMRSSCVSGSGLGVEPDYDSLSLSLFFTLVHAYTHSLSL